MSSRSRNPSEVGTKEPPSETLALVKGLRDFTAQPLVNFYPEAPLDKKRQSITVGAVKWGVYAFLDYDGEPIYVGQTRESLGQRISRHLTNQRTDAVAMAVLDPFEVRFVHLWPLPEYQDVGGDPKRNPAAKAAADHLNALERAVFVKLIAESRFGKVLNEKDPPEARDCDAGEPIVGEIVSEDVRAVRQHPDTRIARRAMTLARLSQIIAGRNVQVGLRRALVTQADRLAWLANARFAALGGEEAVESREGEDDEG